MSIFNVDRLAVIHSAISTMDVNNPAPVNSAAVNGALGGLIKVINTYVDSPQAYSTNAVISYSGVPTNANILSVDIMGYAGFISTNAIQYVIIGTVSNPEIIQRPVYFKVQSDIAQQVRIAYKIVYI